MSHLIKPLLNSELPNIAYGKGIYLFDDTGKCYMDACSGAITANIGHAVPEIISAMHQQMQKISFTYRSQFTNEPAERLAERLHNWAESLGDYAVFFVNSGSEATETALKMVWQAAQERGETKRKIVISRQSSYHGITMGALQVSMHQARRKPFLHLLEEQKALPTPICIRCPLHHQFPQCAHACLDPLEAYIAAYGAEQIVAVITEPIVGAAGSALVPPSGYDQKLADICQKHGITWIADEVMCGMGRSGAKFAVMQSGASPDVILLGKGLAAGYAPLAAVLVKKELIRPIERGSGIIMAGHTHCANPMATAAGLAVLEYMESHDLIKNADNQGKKLKSALRELEKSYEWITDVRGNGLLIGIEWSLPHLKNAPQPLTNAQLIADAFRDGMLLYPSGSSSDDIWPGILVAPPLTINDEEVAELIQWFERWFRKIAPQFGGASS